MKINEKFMLVGLTTILITMAILAGAVITSVQHSMTMEKLAIERIAEQVDELEDRFEALGIIVEE